MADHRVIDISELVISCGVVGISRLSDDQERNAFALATYFYHPARGNPPAFVQWSNLATERTAGHCFAEWLYSHECGEIVCSKSALNPKTGNDICIWTWSIDHEKFKAFWIAKRVERAKGN